MAVVVVLVAVVRFAMHATYCVRPMSAAARRRLPMTEFDAQTPLVGAEGEVPLLDVFEGARSWT